MQGRPTDRNVNSIQASKSNLTPFVNNETFDDLDSALIELMNKTEDNWSRSEQLIYNWYARTTGYNIIFNGVILKMRF